MNHKWQNSEKWLFVVPLLVFAPYLYLKLVGRYMLRHPLYVLAVAYSPNGRTVATGCGDNITRLWNPETGDLEETLSGKTDNVSAIAFSRDGHLIASGTFDEMESTPTNFKLAGHLRIWKMGTLTPLWTLGRNISSIGEGHSLAFSPDSRILASGGAGIEFWDVKTGRLWKRLGNGSDNLWVLAFSKEGSLLATGDYLGQVKLWDWKTSKAPRTLVYSNSKRWVRCVAFSPDGRLIAAGGDDGSLSGPARPWTVKLWNVRTGQLVRTIAAHGNNIRAVKFSPTGKLLATGGYDDAVKLWDVRSGALLRTLPHKDAVSSLDFSPDGKTLATGCDDGKVRLWQLD